MELQHTDSRSSSGSVSESGRGAVIIEDVGVLEMERSEEMNE